MKRNRVLALLAILALCIATLLTFLREDFKADRPHSQDRSPNTSRNPHQTDGAGALVRKAADSTPAATDYSRRPPGFTALGTITRYRNNLAARAPFMLLDLDGNLTPQAIAHFDIDEKELPLLQKAGHEFREAIRKLMEENITRLPSPGSDPSVRSYKMAAFPYESEGSFAAFLDNLTAVVGPEQAWEMAKTMETASVAAAYGQIEVTFDVMDRVPSDPERPFGKISYKLTDPATGRSLGTGLSPKEKMRGFYFGVMDGL